MRSARPKHVLHRLAVAGCAGVLLGGTAAGCQTTQEKATAHQAKSQRILDARAERQAQRKKDKKKDGNGEKSSANGGKKQ